MSIPYHVIHRAVLFPIFFSLFASACSSGGSDRDSSGGAGNSITEISVSEIQGLRDYYEGEMVTLSVKVDGEAASKLSFNWDLDDSIELQGQGTNSITFVAPEVDGQYVVSVRVDADLKNGSLLGDSLRLGFVKVLDLDPPNILTEGFQTKLPEVDSLNLATIEDAELLAVDSFHRTEVVLAGELTGLQRVSRGSANVETISGDLNVKLCGELGSVPLRDLTDPNLDCGSASLARKYYQSGGALRSELYCGDEIVYAINLRSSDTDSRAQQGEVLFSVDESEFLQDSTSACMERVDVLLCRYDETLASPMKYVSEGGSRYRIEVPKPAGSIVLEIIGSKTVSSFATFDLNELFDENDANSATIYAPDIPTVNGLEANDGSVSIFNLDDDEYEVEFDLYFETENDPRMQIRGESILYLP